MADRGTFTIKGIEACPNWPVKPANPYHGRQAIRRAQSIIAIKVLLNQADSQ